MKSWIFLGLLVVYLHWTSARLHSQRNLETGSSGSGITNFTEFIAVGFVDDVPIEYYDGNIRRAVPKQDWMNKVTADDPHYWETQTQICLGNQQVFQANIRIIMQRFNQTGGVHTFQRMVGCEWDDETGEINGIFQDGYDGEDFITFDLKTETWIAAKPQAVPTKEAWDRNTALLEQIKFYFTQECPFWLKKFLDYGNSTLRRTDLPSVSLLQKTSSSSVRCFATGFYPKNASLVWRRDNVEIHEDVEHGEILPNQDGTFQMSVDLDVSSVRVEDWGRLDCVFQHSGVNGHQMVTRLEKDQIRTNWVPEPPPVSAIVIGVVVGLLILLVVTLGLIAWRRNWYHRVNQYFRFLVGNSNSVHIFQWMYSCE
ncbi:uncharacterized protein V6R79_016334 [Siganus canaliculatus]